MLEERITRGNDDEDAHNTQAQTDVDSSNNVVQSVKADRTKPFTQPVFEVSTAWRHCTFLPSTRQ